MCTPSKSSVYKEPCGFSNLPKKVIDPEEIPSLSISEKPFTEINFSRLDEFLDYLKFPTLTLVKGTVLCHSSEVRNFYNKNKGINLDTIYWWNEYFPGQASYKGGWFTYDTSYGGPDFGLDLYYELQEDLTLLFIPNDFDEKYKRSDPRYFSEYHQIKNKIDILSNIIKYLYIGDDKSFVEMDNYINTIPESEEDLKIKELMKQILTQPSDSDAKYSIIDSLTKIKNVYLNLIKKHIGKESDSLYSYSENFRSSHIIEGVEDWEKKGYEPLEHPLGSYADYLAIKLANLGFNGYISCDECEVYITHEAMKRVLTKPFRFDLHQKTLSDEEYSIVKSLLEKSFEMTPLPLTVTRVINREIPRQLFVPIDEFSKYISL